jgi:hypothetical protein
MIDKIRKLLLLSQNNPNVHEAAAAFGRAQEIASKHAIDLDMVDTCGERLAPPNVTQKIVDACGRIETWRWQLVQAVARANRCNVFVSPGRGVGVYGTAADIAVTAEISRVIRDTIVHLSRQAGRGKGRTFSRNFRIGAVHEIGQRMREADARALEESRQTAEIAGNTDAHSTALVRRAVVARAVKDYGDQNFKAKGRIYKGATSFGYDQGRIAGRSIGLASRGALK